MLKRWIVVVSTPSLCVTFSIAARFFSIRCDRGGADLPGSGSAKYAASARVMRTQKLFFISIRCLSCAVRG